MEPIQIGRYVAVQLLGRGGMGSVYLATDPALDRQIVVKLLSYAHDQHFRERFVREARSAGRLRHRNIVTIYDIGTDAEDRPYIAMEYVEGDTLAAIVRQRAPLTLAQKLDYLKQVCAGLETAHSAGIIHRDVKPANIMVDRSDTIKILDFGLAQLQDSGLTQVGTVMGTLNYMSPEQFTGQLVDKRSDIFAVGAVAYELLAYRQAFPGRLDSGAMHRLMTAEPEPLGDILPGLDPDLETMVAKCLEKDPANRYQNLASMSAAVDRLVKKLGEKAHRILEPAGAAPGLTPGGRSELLDHNATRIAPPPEVKPATVPPADAGTRYFPPSDRDAQSQEMPDVQVVISSRGTSGVGDRVVRITQATTVIGRNPACDIVLSDPACSSRHAAITYANGSFTLEDMGSRNGTYVNGLSVRRNAPFPLIFGARIEIGGTTLRFSYLKDTRLPDLAGARLTTRYTLTRLLRESEKSAFYAAVDRNVDLEVAVKVFSPELARHPAYEAQFKREARIAAQLEHPHICRLLDSGVGNIVLSDGRRLPRALYLCYQLMGGGSLAERLDGDKPPVDIDLAGRWTRVLGDALTYAHARGVIHGDLKPTAIVFNTTGLLFLTDFAIAQRAEAADARPTIGWPEYMAPEQWDGGTATEATDQFALAALLYRLVTGSVPFEGQDNRKQRERNFRDGPAPAHKEAARNGRQGVSSELSEVLRRALSPDPASRYIRIEEFVAAVVPLLREGVRPKARHDVFLSYDRELSGAWAKQLENRLHEKHNLRVFMDTTGLDRAGSFPPRIAAAIENSEIFICFLASTTLESRWVRTEIGTAHQHGKTMIPVFQETFGHQDLDEQDPGVLALVDSQGVKLYDKSMEYTDEAMKRIANLVIDALRGQE